MSVRVVARIRPLLKSELTNDTVVSACSSDGDDSKRPTIVRIPNPKKNSEVFNFQFNSVYEDHASQQEIFDNEGTA